MNEKSVKKQKYAIYDFIGEGKSMYDFLEKYANIGDPSPKGIINWFRTIFDVQKFSGSVQSMHYEYSRIFASLMKGLEKSMKIDKMEDGIYPMSKEDEADLLSRLQNADPERRKLNTISEYITLVKENNFTEKYYVKRGIVDPYYDSLNKILLDSAIKVGNRVEIEKSADAILHSVSPNIIKSNIREMYKDDSQFTENELQKANFVINTLGRPERKAQYDQILRKYHKEIQKNSEKLALKLECEGKRESEVLSEILGNKNPIENVRKRNEGIDKLIYKGKPSRLKPGSYSWRVNLSKEPEVILDELAEYSPKGIENQRVVAIDYGNFEYDTFFRENGEPTISSNNLHLVGVTRIGRDGVKNYFVIMPTAEKQLKNKSELTEDDKVLNLKLNNKNAEIKSKDGLDKYVFVKTDKVPKSKAKFYAKYALSDVVLEKAIQENNRFVGYILDTKEGPKINGSYKDFPTDVEAVKYAASNPGYCRKRRCNSLSDILISSDLLLKHLKNVKNLYPGKFYSESTVINEREDEGEVK